MKWGLFRANYIGATKLIGHFEKHPDEDAFIAPTLLADVKCLVRPALRRRSPPAQVVAMEKAFTDQYLLVVQTEFAMGLEKKKAPVWASAHPSAGRNRSCQSSVFETVKHATQRKSTHSAPDVGVFMSRRVFSGKGQLKWSSSGHRGA